MVSYVCIVFYSLFYRVCTCMVSLNPDDGYFSCQVVDDEIGLSARPRSQSWSREHRGRCWGGRVLCQLWKQCSSCHMVAKVGPSYRVHIAWQNITLGFQSPLQKDTTSLGAQTVKNLPPMQETQDQSLGWEDPLEKDLATHSSFLVWRIQ